MTSAEGSRQVPGGWYWNPERHELRSVPPEGGALPDDRVRWRRLPGWLLIAAAPILGGLFVVGLPVYGAAVVVHAVATKTLVEATRAARALATSLSTGHATGEAHLGGAPPGEKPAEGEDAGLDEVEREVRERKDAEKK